MWGEYIAMIIVNQAVNEHYPGVLIHDGKTYWRKETIRGMSKRDALYFMADDDVVVRAPIKKIRNRYDYVLYTLMWEYVVDIRPDLQEEGSIVMDKRGRVLSPIKEFYHPIQYSYGERLPKKWWESSVKP
jgi:hypothetical protein